MEIVLHVLVLVCIYTILAVSLDLLAGHAGMISVAHAAFYGLGAYTSALLTVRLGASFSVGVLAGMGVAAFVSFLISLPSMRLREDYFVVATFGFQMIIFSILNNWTDLTHGPLGIKDIPPPVILGKTISSRLGFFILSGAVAIIAYQIIQRIAQSPFGRVLHAVREDEVFAESLGKNTLRFKVIAFSASAAVAASAGSLFAHYNAYIDPASFTVTESVLVISMVIIGGAGSRWGPLFGASILVILPEVLRYIGLPNTVAANLLQIIYGLLLVVLMMFCPHGLTGRYNFGR